MIKHIIIKLKLGHYNCCLVSILQVVLLNVYDVMIKAVMVVPRVETKLYSEWVSLQLALTNSEEENVHLKMPCSIGKVFGYFVLI